MGKRSIGGAALVLCIAACGGDDQGSGGASDSSTAASSGPTSAAGTESSSTSASATGSSSGTESTTSPTTGIGDASSGGTTAGGEPWDCPSPAAPPTCDPAASPTPPLFATAPTVIDTEQLSVLYEPIYTVDLEGDGDIDVISQHVSGIGLLLNDGSGNFELRPSSDMIFSPNRVVVADVDGDCTIDVMYIAAFEPNAFALWAQRGSPEGFLPPQEVLIDGIDVVESTELGGPYDFDGDGAPDLVVTVDGTSTIAFHDNVQVGFTLGDPLPFEVSIGSRQGAIDFDGDGIAAEVACEPTASGDPWSGVCRIDATGFVLPPGQTLSEGLYIGYDHTRLADMDGDGDLDRINAPNTQDYVFVQPFNDTTMLFGDQEGSYPLGNDPLVADIDLDCDADGAGSLINVGNPAPLLISYGDGPYSWPDTEQYDVADSRDPFAAVDIDGDGDLDLLTAERSDFAIYRSSAAP